MKTDEQLNESPQLISYLSLRKAVGILGISFPVILVTGSVVCAGCEEIQGSISSYYHTGMRNIFVGILCAIALFMFAYKGYDQRDAMAGKLACIFALGVAFFPTSVSGPFTKCLPVPIDNHLISSIHFVSATLLFATLSYFSIALFTLSSKKPTTRKRKRNRLYMICGYAMIGSIVLIGVYILVFEKRYPALQSFDPVFWLESIALWAFGISWLTKGKAILNDVEINDL